MWERGRNLKEAEKIVYFIANGRKIAHCRWLIYIERFESFRKEAEENTPGIERPWSRTSS